VERLLDSRFGVVMLNLEYCAEVARNLKVSTERFNEIIGRYNVVVQRMNDLYEEFQQTKKLCDKIEAELMEKGASTVAVLLSAEQDLKQPLEDPEENPLEGWRKLLAASLKMLKRDWPQLFEASVETAEPAPLQIEAPKIVKRDRTRRRQDGSVPKPPARPRRPKNAASG